MINKLINKYRGHILIFLGIISAISIMLSILMVFGNNTNPRTLVFSVLTAIFSSWVLIYLLKNRCEECGALLSAEVKDINKEQIITEPKVYYSQILKRKDGSEQPILSSRRVVHLKKQVDKIIYRCRECDSTWVKRKSYYLESPPTPKYVYEK